MVEIWEEGLCDIVNAMLDSGAVTPEDYTGFHKDDKKTEFIISFGKSYTFLVEFIMSERENGDYDGLEGFNIHAL